LTALAARRQGRAQESVDPTGVIAQAIPARQRARLRGACQLLAGSAGRVRHHFGNRLILGEPRWQPTAHACWRWPTLLQRAGIQAEVSPQIQKDIWFKLWGNLTINPISALTGATTDRILDDDLVRGFVSAVMLEAKAIGARSACRLTSSPKTATPSRASWARSRPRCCRTWRRASPWRLTPWWAQCASWGRSPAPPRPTPTPCWAWCGPLGVDIIREDRDSR
jgi:hypothetical protein